MSIRPKDDIRDTSDVLPAAVWIALSTNLNIKTLDPLDAYMKRKDYVFCDRKNSKRLIGVKFTNSEDLEFEEYSENPVQGNSLHIFKCMQYTKDSEEDKQQIQNVANLILTFCNEVMSKRKPQPVIQMSKRLLSDDYSDSNSDFEMSKRRRSPEPGDLDYSNSKFHMEFPTSAIVRAEDVMYEACERACSDSHTYRLTISERMPQMYSFGASIFLNVRNVRVLIVDHKLDEKVIRVRNGITRNNETLATMSIPNICDQNSPQHLSKVNTLKDLIINNVKLVMESSN
jgi:hypothetical protein